jgi:hypothetical protein
MKSLTSYSLMYAKIDEYDTIIDYMRRAQKLILESKRDLNINIS